MHTTLAFEMLYAGHDLNEPHLRHMLDGILKQLYEKLKKKLSIKVKVCTTLFVLCKADFPNDVEVLLFVWSDRRTWSPEGGRSVFEPS